MPKTLLVILNIILFLGIGYTQGNYRQELDSLIHLTTYNRSAIEEVELLNKIARAYFNHPDTNVKDSSKYYALLAKEKAIKENYLEGQADATYELGKYYIGSINKPGEATPLLLESLELYNKLNNAKGISKCYLQLGMISYLLKYYEAAVEQLQKSLNAHEQPVSKYLLALSYTELDSFDLAKEYFSRSIKDYTGLKDNHRLNECYLWLGRLHLKTGQLDSAFQYMNKSINGIGSQNNDYDLTRPYAFIAQAYLESEDIQKAIYFAKASFDLETNKTTQGKDNISLIQATNVLSKAYALKKNYREAYNFLELYNKANNEFASGSLKQKVADMQSMFEFEQELNTQKIKQQKDKEIAQQQIAKEKILRNAFLFGSALLMLILIILYSNFKEKQKANKVLRDLNNVITEEKKRSDDLLLNILPVEIAEELKQKGSADARHFDLVSILFTDFKEFTQMSEKLSAKNLVAEINHCFMAFDEICEKYGVEKIKTIGDSYMVAGGLPVPNKNSTKNLVLAALEMADFIINRKLELEEDGRIGFEMRCGIHTGNVVAGIVGVKKFQYDIWGDTVNTASRIESNGKIGTVNISQTTYEILKDDPSFLFHYRGKVNAKGKGEIEMWFVEKS